MEYLINLLNSNLTIALILLLVIVPIYHKIGLLSWLTDKRGGVPVNPIESKMDTLTQYFNHDTTEILTDIRGELKEQGLQNDKILRKLDVVIAKTNEIITYGVPDRKS